ncbi:MAG: adenylate/guanylate cyclase domain-containing protein [Alphaproteobacteria bacterium]|nr:adenylate/guanylate cyclase domain-containing protein [Alphaproteobacteria bacterium]
MFDLGTIFIFLITFGLSSVLLAMFFLTPADMLVLRRIVLGTANRGGAATPQAGATPARAAAAEAAEEPAADEAAADEATEEGAAEEQADQPAGDAQGAMAKLMKFLEASISDLIAQKVNLTTTDKFGANLFLAGACEVVRNENRLNDKQLVELLEKVLALIGNKREVAHRLADKYEEYLLEPQYIRMFQAGTAALDRFATGDQKAIKEFAKAILEWRNPKAAQSGKAQGPITVLFTDIVGSTKATQQFGDEGGQQLVRAHNAIVRTALKDHAGIEVKHTGDGIMARFGQASNAVEASLQMIKGVADHNKTKPPVTLHMRIGINAGEPIVEDNDLFGSTVQMAARICDAAETDHVLVSNIVRELCHGKAVTFREAGK